MKPKPKICFLCGKTCDDDFVQRTDAKPTKHYGHPKCLKEFKEWERRLLK